MPSDFRLDRERGISAVRFEIPLAGGRGFGGVGGPPARPGFPRRGNGKGEIGFLAGMPRISAGTFVIRCSGRIRTPNRSANAGSDHRSKSENNGSRNVLHANPSWVYAGPGSGFCFSRSSYDAAQHALSVTYFVGEPSGCR